MKRLLENIVSLGALQLVNNILPLVSIPYLVVVLGPEKFGVLAFLSSLILFFVLVTDYGFNLTATKGISENRHDQIVVSEIYCSVMLIKFILMLICFIVMNLLAAVLSELNHYIVTAHLTFLLVIGRYFTPTWLYHGFEDIKILALITLISRLVYTLSIFMLINSADDYSYVPLLNGISFIIAGISLNFVALKRYNIVIKSVSISQLRLHLKDGWSVFLSSFMISQYTTLTPFFLGVFLSEVVVGYFSAAEKVIAAAKSSILPLTQALLPYLSYKHKKDSSDGQSILMFRKLILLVIVIMLPISIFIYHFSNEIIFLLYGSQLEESVIFLKIMAPIPTLVALSSISCILIIFNFDYKTLYRRIYFYNASIAIIAILYFASVKSTNYVVFSLVVVELGILLSSVYFIKKYSILEKNFNGSS